jgi:hypothetical protein
VPPDRAVSGLVALRAELGAAEVAVLEFDDYAGHVFEGIAAGYRYGTGLAHR